MSDMLRFLYIALREYWITWVTGTGLVGFVLWAINIYDKRRVEKGRRPMTWRTNVLILFCAFWFLATFSAWHDADKNLRQVITDRAVDVGKLNTCSGDLKTERALADSFQAAFVSMQAPRAQQEANITSCINNLAKMNPVIREKIDVIEIPIGTIDSKGHFVGPNKFISGYINELLIITNEPERAFHGDLKCDKDFSILQPPKIKATASVVMTGSEPPKPISGKEYEIAVNATGTEWNPTHPAYLQVTSYEEDLGRCAFTPEE